MNNSSQKTVRNRHQYLIIVFYLLIGAVCGFLMVSYAHNMFRPDQPLWRILFSLAGLLFIMYFSIFLQIIFHEAGHLVFGLMSGYHFCSFRIMNFMWVKESGVLRFRQLAVAGTGGQCLMSPPEFHSGKLPVVLYNLGGSLMNALTALLFLGLYFLLPNKGLLSVMFLMLTAIGFSFAVMNILPLRTDTIDTDGYNILSLLRDPAAPHAFWIQMKINELTSQGIRMKDMPEEWFVLPADDELKTNMTAALGVYACNRLMDEHHFKDADRLMIHILEADTGMTGLHRSLLVCDRIFCELIGQNRSEVLKDLLTEEQKKFFKTMKRFPSVLRTEYAYALLACSNTEKADRILALFDQYAQTYPYPSDIQAERELIEIARASAKGQQE